MNHNPLLLFIRDMWQTVLFFCIGYALIVATILLSFRTLVRQSNFMYAYVLGLTMLVVFLVLEYVRRHRFYTELAYRLKKEAVMSDAVTMPVTGTHDQRLFVQLLHRYHQEHVRQLDVLIERQRVYELFGTRFAHQMKTPLTVIQLLEDEMRREFAWSTDMAEIVSRLSEERLRLDTSVNLMLNTMRLGSFSVDVHIEEVDLQELVREAVNEHKSQWIRRAIYPRLDGEDCPVVVKSDRKWLLFIMDQIIRNALQYGYRVDEDGIPAEVANSFVIQIKKRDHYAVLVFSDNGIGIPARDLAHVFEPFYTGSNGRSHSRATGMGLYIVKQVAERLGHDIRIESNEGRGTTVFVSISLEDFLRPLLTT
ncbi:HAMP domain-containing sensor histidine kinase [Alicyclobacillus sp. SP_1]|jgi:OmpR family two-component system sensor histidine kinase YxdK|uniref:sensor histidine kinase n=1 Tax=Alicyclobacillus sp. SP_1 TaxID=2942475 RepID=UPI002157475E|nr:sensor histidine kinase [Alicyclobacillus sp. SP_1]